jgi:pyoverdine/dityrosine biosynthesis protein Dit1
MALQLTSGQRNQAYTNLLETFFPMHVRLSAHAYEFQCNCAASSS